MCEMGIDVPVQYMLGEQNAWINQHNHRNSDIYHHYRSLTKRKAVQRHEKEKSYMTALKEQVNEGDQTSGSVVCHESDQGIIFTQ